MPNHLHWPHQGERHCYNGVLLVLAPLFDNSKETLIGPELLQLDMEYMLYTNQGSKAYYAE